MIEKEVFKSREAWLMARRGFIGGSDASCIMGANPWKSNVDLWREKMGIKVPDDLSNNDLVNYGSAAEQFQRELFKLDYPNYKVMYEENNMWHNSSYPYAHASLDGWILDKNKNFGIFECKTATIQNAAQKRKWEFTKFPDYYYWQILHYMLVTDATFAILRAQIKINKPDEEVNAWIKHYRINRDDEEYNIYRLMLAEEQFANCIKENKEPALVLPL